jgi:hypothetical protein
LKRTINYHETISLQAYEIYCKKTLNTISKSV